MDGESVGSSPLMRRSTSGNRNRTEQKSLFKDFVTMREEMKTLMEGACPGAWPGGVARRRVHDCSSTPYFSPFPFSLPQMEINIVF